MTTIDTSIFKEYDIRGRFGPGFDERSAYALGVALVRHHKAKKMVVARDARLECAQLLPALIAGAQSVGAQVIDLGITATPVLFFAARELKTDVGVMATASHNPLGYAGLKIVGRDGLPVGLTSGLRQIARLARAVNVPADLTPKRAKYHDISNAYYRFIAKFASLKNLVGTSIVMDMRHGSAATIGAYCIKRLPLTSDIINAGPARRPSPEVFNPLLPTNHRGIRWRIRAKRATFGVMFDGDGDRCVFFDERGQFIPPYYLNCLLAKIIAERHPKALITVDARLPVGISEVISSEQGRPLVSRSGYVNIMKKMTQSKALFGCENSAHYFFSTRLIGARRGLLYADAIIPVVLIAEYLREHQVRLSQLIKNFSTLYPISGEVNIPDVDSSLALAAVKKLYPKLKTSSVDGLSLYASDWFANIRSSKTEPLIRLNVEAREQAQVARLKRDLTSLIISSAKNTRPKT